jgi:hypothetical protein
MFQISRRVWTGPGVEDPTGDCVVTAVTTEVSIAVGAVVAGAGAGCVHPAAISKKERISRIPIPDRMCIENVVRG